MLKLEEEILNAKQESYRLCGTHDLMQAFAQIEKEREDMLKLHEKNIALAIHIRRLDEILRLSNTIVQHISAEGNLFLSESLRQYLERYKNLFKEIEKQLQEALKL
jgi:hypothetical protein